MATKDENGTVLARKEQKLKPPPMYQVLLLNDDYTPMEFVVAIIQEYFNKDRETATQRRPRSVESRGPAHDLKVAHWSTSASLWGGGEGRVRVTD